MIEKEKKDGSENPSEDVEQLVPTMFYQQIEQAEAPYLKRNKTVW